MKILVSGAAGFIASHLAEALLESGHEVIGLDCFTDYYSRSLKEKNLETAKKFSNFKFIEADLNQANLDEILNSCQVVYHQAAQAGVRSSWGKNFEIYLRNNILATQKLLEAARSKPIKKFIFASSSSVYGMTQKFPMKENHPLLPVSPYGVTKLAAENLVYLYWKNFGVSTVSLRYFTVFGPRQRPDMAFTRFIKAILKNESFDIYGDGQQVRDFTFVGDAVAANLNLLKIESEKFAGRVFNIGGGNPASVNEVIKIIEKISGQKARPNYQEFQKGDVLKTKADTTGARKILKYKPATGLADGLKAQIEWLEGSLKKGLIF